MQKWIIIVFIWEFCSMLVADVVLDYTAVCDRLTCKIDESCVIRKFWCDYTRCPTISYCSKSRLESLRGPESCESVLCSHEYQCVLRFRDCIWDHGCKQQFARCISEVEFVDELATCANVKCGKGYHCILREMHYCPSPPCRLTKSCVHSEEIEMWFDKCRQLGCRSEHECFLRRPLEKCAMSSCSHIPDCLVTPDTFDSISKKLCYGWICPSDQVCSARLPAICRTPGANCPIIRSCNRVLRDLAQHTGAQTTLTDLERDTSFEEQRRFQQHIKPLFISNFTQTRIQQYYGDLLLTGQSGKNLDDAVLAPMKSSRVSASPIMRSISQQGSDSAWLTYLKRRAGAEAVRYWIEKAKSKQDYEGFVEWLDMISQLLDPETYRLWLMEIESATVNVPEFQAWILQRNLAAHRFATASDSQRTLPVSIADKAKNIFYGDLPQDFGEAVKSSWKPWQSYYQLNPPSPSEFAGRMADTHLENNYTKASGQNASMPKLFFVNDRYTTTLKRDDDDMAARGLGAMIDQIRGFKNFRPDLTKANFNQSASQLMLSPTDRDDGHLPNLLIYFPPPLNFFIYYSVGRHNLTTAGNVSLKTDNEGYSEPRLEMGTRLSSTGSYVPEDYDDNPNFYNKTVQIDKQKEFEFIRKIIRELINYWDDEERISNKFGGDAVGARMGNFYESPSNITSTQTDKIKPNKDEERPSFNTFLEWLFKNGHINVTQLSDLNLRRKQPPFDEEQEKSNFFSSNLEKNTSKTEGNIRVLVDIDKNSEFMKKLFSINNTNNQNESDPRQYQVIINLNDYVERQEEDLISKKLINIASKQLHRNITGDEKMPKVLWVFPVYGDEKNETIINEIKKRSKEDINTLEAAPTENTGDNEGTHYMPDSQDVNSANDNVDSAKNVDNFNGAIQDAEDEYYDDHDMYDEDDYELSESNQSKEHILSEH